MNTKNETMNTKDLERAAVGLVRDGFQFSVGNGIIIVQDPVQSSAGNFCQPVELRTLHAVRKFLEVRS